MFKAKLIISVSLFFTLLVVTSVIKNQTRIIEKKIVNLKANALNKKNVINEAQLDFHYLSSPFELEKKIKYLHTCNMNFLKIYVGNLGKKTIDHFLKNFHVIN